MLPRFSYDLDCFIGKALLLIGVLVVGMVSEVRQHCLEATGFAVCREPLACGVSPLGFGVMVVGIVYGTLAGRRSASV